MPKESREQEHSPPPVLDRPAPSSDNIYTLSLNRTEEHLEPASWPELDPSPPSSFRSPSSGRELPFLSTFRVAPEQDWAAEALDPTSSAGIQLEIWFDQILNGQGCELAVQETGSSGEQRDMLHSGLLEVSVASVLLLIAIKLPRGPRTASNPTSCVDPHLSRRMS
jgi:hypothetical protein